MFQIYKFMCAGHCITRALRFRFTSPKPPAAALQSPETLGKIPNPALGKRKIF